MEKLRLLLAAALLCLGALPVKADKIILKDGKSVFGTVVDEKDSLIRYFDRYERPRKMAAGLVDTIHYDAGKVSGLVKVAFRKGQPKDRSGFFRLRHSEELDLEVEYKTDSITEMDLFFRNNVHVRVLPGCHFMVRKAPKSMKDELVIDLYAGRMLATGAQSEALARFATTGGVGVGRGVFQLGVLASPKDSTILVSCLRGLTGIQENVKSPGELVVDEGKAVSLALKEGVFEPREPDAQEVAALAAVAGNMGHYRFSPIEYPKIGYLPKAITGLGFMVFFYGSAIGILNYVNQI